MTNQGVHHLVLLAIISCCRFVESSFIAKIMQFLYFRPVIFFFLNALTMLFTLKIPFDKYVNLSDTV